jgi:hypothetical protein
MLKNNTSTSCLAICWVFFFFLSAAVGHAQEEKTLFGDRSLKSTGGWGGYRMQIGQIAQQNAQISGFHFTGEYDRKLLAGYNFNWMTNDVSVNFEGRSRNLEFRWHSFQLGYQIASHRAIHPVLGLDLGLGRAKATDLGKDRLYVLNPSAGLELNLYRWFHLALEGGYRWVSGVNIAGLDGEDFSGAFGQISLKFGWGEDD